MEDQECWLSFFRKRLLRSLGGSISSNLAPEVDFCYGYESLRAILELERKEGYSNKAVIGGLDGTFK